MTRDRVGGIRLQVLNFIMIAVVVLVAVLLLVGINRLSDNYHDLKDNTDIYILCETNADSMMDASDYLTEQAREFAVTGDIAAMDNYFAESEQTKRRDNALASLEENMPGSEALTYLQSALDESIALMEREYYSMRLVIDAKGYDLRTIPDSLQEVKLTAADQKLPAEEKMEKARTLMFDEEYESQKEAISGNVEGCLNQLLEGIQTRQEANFRDMAATLRMTNIMIAVMILLFLLMILLIIFLVLQPLRNNIGYINEKMRLPMKGAFELQYLASVYNRMYDENQEHSDLLAYEAIHDRLTGAYNRAGFEERFHAADHNTIALVLIDVDEFKGINDNYGHSVGDLILKRVVYLIQTQFRAEDYVCRIGGDEFAIIMLFVDSTMQPQVMGKINAINRQLQNPTGNLPKTSLSVGVAFGDRKNPTEDMFKDADAALYEVKRSGRNGCRFYGEE
ncbi:MAG: GGDEF domain-containing protein [Firmicutes bacterium]|nr:GGDEF domain-containing protein [Bacillota bacterium]MBQ9016534.1 GGDEF domain-containing protein [Bacillota bacterium]